MPANPQAVPTNVPVTTCAKLCCRSNMRAVPTAPENNTKTHNHPTGLNTNNTE